LSRPQTGIFVGSEFILTDLRQQKGIHLDYKQTALFIGHRVLMTIFLLITIPTVVFFLLEAAPDNPFELDPAADEESLSARYIDWLGDSLIGRDFGDSQVMRRSAYDSFTERVNASLDILIGALLLSFLFGLPLGVLAAAFPRNIPDVLARYGLLILVALPIFWVGMMLILELGINRDWLPLGNRFPVGFALGEEVPLSERIKHLIMPVATMAIFWASAIAFMTRNFLVDFKAGHAERTNTILMGLPLAVLATLPVVVAGMMSSLVLVETIFSWPGFGRLLFSSVSQLDYPVMSAIIVMVTVYTTLIYFLCMVMYAMVCMIFRITANGFAVSGQFPLQAIAEQQTLESPQPARTVIPSIVGIIVAGIALFVLLGIVVAVFTSDADPNETSLQDRLLPRGSEGYPLGTDDLGRDVQARLLAGGRTSLNIAFQQPVSAWRLASFWA
jgi:peptide/nickel transport system permease protein